MQLNIKQSKWRIANANSTTACISWHMRWNLSLNVIKRHGTTSGSVYVLDLCKHFPQWTIGSLRHSQKHLFVYFPFAFPGGVKVAGKVGPDFTIPSHRFYLLLGDPPYFPKPTVRYNLSNGSCFGVSALWDVRDAEGANKRANMFSAQTISSGSLDLKVQWLVFLYSLGW